MNEWRENWIIGNKSLNKWFRNLIKFAVWMSLHSFAVAFADHRVQIHRRLSFPWWLRRCHWRHKHRVLSRSIVNRISWNCFKSILDLNLSTTVSGWWYKTFCECVLISSHLNHRSRVGEFTRHRHPLVYQIRLVVTRATMILRLEFRCVGFTVSNFTPSMNEQSDRSHP